jgi:ApaG protein
MDKQPAPQPPKADPYIEGLRVTVDRVEHRPSSGNHPNRPHQFAYFITIHNDTPHVVRIESRKWVITNSAGDRQIIEGDGVVGQFPEINPGNCFHYHSYHLVDSSSFAEGRYTGVANDEHPVAVRIPRFEMHVEQTS